MVILFHESVSKSNIIGNMISKCDPGFEKSAEDNIMDVFIDLKVVGSPFRYSTDKKCFSGASRNDLREYFLNWGSPKATEEWFDEYKVPVKYRKYILNYLADKFANKYYDKSLNK